MLDALLVKEFTEADILEAYFLEALYWSLGGALLEDGRVKFDAFIKNNASMSQVTDEGQYAGPGEMPGQLETLHEYFFDDEKMKVSTGGKRVCFAGGDFGCERPSMSQVLIRVSM